MSLTSAPHTNSAKGRATVLVAIVAATAALTTGCSGSSSSGAKVPGAPGAKSGSALADAAPALDELIAAEKPADASLMPAGSTAAQIKKRGQLLVGGTQTAALFSLLDPTTGKVGGFDAALSRLLAQYIIGKPSTKLVNVTSQTREALLKNHSVDAVFATYTITPQRAEVINFAGPYYMDGLSIQVKKGNSDITSLEGLAGKTVVGPPCASSSFLRPSSRPPRLWSAN